MQSSTMCFQPRNENLQFFLILKSDCKQILDIRFYYEPPLEEMEISLKGHKCSQRTPGLFHEFSSIGLWSLGAEYDEFGSNRIKGSPVICAIQWQVIWVQHYFSYILQKII